DRDRDGALHDRADRLCRARRRGHGADRRRARRRMAARAGRVGGPGAGRGAAAPPPRVPWAPPFLRQPLAWQVTLFFALQSGGFYSTLAWLPDIFRSHGASDSRAGFLLSLSIVVGLLTSATLPVLATRLRDQRGLVAVCMAVGAAGAVGSP